MNKNPYSTVFIFLVSLFCLLSCGLEDVLFLDYIPDGFINDNTSARVFLPSGSAEGYSTYFTNFMIYYRIYISGEAFSGLIDSTNRKQINNYLDTDFLSLYNLTDKTSTSANPSNLEASFITRRFFKLNLENANINSVLGTGSLGQMLEIQFPTVNGERPVLILNGVSYSLERAKEGQNIVFTPKPDLLFMNHQDLYATANATNTINADVAVPNNNTPELPRYTYVSMYIFAVGREYLSTVYSQPTHIGVFRLPEAF